MVKGLIRNRHKYLAMFWMVMAVPTVLWWKESILWLAILSLYANIEASLAAMEAQKNENS